MPSEISVSCETKVKKAFLMAESLDTRYIMHFFVLVFSSTYCLWRQAARMTDQSGAFVALANTVRKYSYTALRRLHNNAEIFA